VAPDPAIKHVRSLKMKNKFSPVLKLAGNLYEENYKKGVPYTMLFLISKHT
jgi:hypothetical protein